MKKKDKYSGGREKFDPLLYPNFTRNNFLIINIRFRQTVTPRIPFIVKKERLQEIKSKEKGKREITKLCGI